MNNTVIRPRVFYNSNINKYKSCMALLAKGNSRKRVRQPRFASQSKVRSLVVEAHSNVVSPWDECEHKADMVISPNVTRQSDNGIRIYTCDDKANPMGGLAMARSEDNVSIIAPTDNESNTFTPSMVSETIVKEGAVKSHSCVEDNRDPGMLLFDVNGIGDDKFMHTLHSINNLDYIQGVQCENYKQWQIQSKYDFGFIPLSDFFTSDTKKRDKETYCMSCQVA